MCTIFNISFAPCLILFMPHIWYFFCTKINTFCTIFHILGTMFNIISVPYLILFNNINIRFFGIIFSIFLYNISYFLYVHDVLWVFYLENVQIFFLMKKYSEPLFYVTDICFYCNAYNVKLNWMNTSWRHYCTWNCVST